MTIFRPIVSLEESQLMGTARNKNHEISVSYDPADQKKWDFLDILFMKG